MSATSPVAFSSCLPGAAQCEPRAPQQPALGAAGREAARGGHPEGAPANEERGAEAGVKGARRASHGRAGAAPCGVGLGAERLGGLEGPGGSSRRPSHRAQQQRLGFVKPPRSHLDTDFG